MHINNIIFMCNFSSFKFTSLIHLQYFSKRYIFNFSVRTVLGVHRCDNIRSFRLLQGHHDRTNGPDVPYDAPVRTGQERRLRHTPGLRHRLHAAAHGRS